MARAGFCPVRAQHAIFWKDVHAWLQFCDSPDEATPGRPTVVLLVFFLFILIASSQPAYAYGVLTHHHLIDEAWHSIIVPILQSRYPSLTPQQLRRAHAYAYGGCIIQDLGYYPFSNSFFSELTHYVRTGDFVRSLFSNAHNADELAFAIGALTHYVGDTLGHSQATNRAVALCFPKLRAKYGPSVNFGQDQVAHSRVEFAFDINQVTKRRLAPSRYLRYIGLRVPRRQLTAAFYETYGFQVSDVIGLYRPAVRTYRFGARSFLPGLAYAEAVLHHDGFPPDSPGPQLDLFERRVAELSREADWDRYRRKPGVRTHLLAALIFILPKIGPIKMLAIKGPTVDTERMYIDSVNLSTATLRLLLRRVLAADGSPGVIDGNPVGARRGRYARTFPTSLLPNRDLDTGERVVPGGYALTDQAYAKLLAKVTEHPETPVPAVVKQDILKYYSDPSAPISTKRNKKQWARVQQQLQLLTRIPSRAEPE